MTTLKAQKKFCGSQNHSVHECTAIRDIVTSEVMTYEQVKSQRQNENKSGRESRSPHRSYSRSRSGARYQ